MPNVTTLITKPVRNFRKLLQEQINTGVKEAAEKVGRYKGWQFEVGNNIKSKRTGKTYEVIGKSWNPSVDQPTYRLRGKSASEQGNYFANKAHEEFEKYSGPYTRKVFGPAAIAGGAAAMTTPAEAVTDEDLLSKAEDYFKPSTPPEQRVSEEDLALKTAAYFNQKQPPAPPEEEASLPAKGAEMSVGGVTDDSLQTKMQQYFKGPEPVPNAPIPLRVQEAYTQRTNQPAPETYPEDEEGLSWWKSLALDLAAYSTGAAVAGRALSMFPHPVPKLAGLTLMALGGGATVEAAKGLVGEKPETLIGDVVGQEAPGMTTLEWGAYPASFKVLGKAVKYTAKGTGKVISGVDKLVHNPLEKVNKILSPAATAVWENIFVKPTNVPIPWTGRTLREHVQPGVERLAASKLKPLQGAAATIRRAEAQKSLTTHIGRTLMQGAKDLTPTERYDLTKGIRGTPIRQLKEPRAIALLKKMKSEVKDVGLDKMYKSVFASELSKGLTKEIAVAEEAFSPNTIRNTLKVFEKMSTKGVSPRETERMLDEIISHPDVSDTFKDFAKAMYNVPARTPMAVADAARKASTSYLTQKMIAERGLISAIEKPGYVKSSWGKLAGKWVPRDVELQLQDISRIPRIARGIYTKWFLSPWKASKTIMRPAYHFRNTMSNLVLNDWGGLPWYRTDVYMNALKKMRASSPEWKKYVQATGAGGDFVQNDIYQLGAGLEYGANMLDKMYSVYDRIIQPVAGFQRAEEHFFKFAKHLHNLEQGVDFNESIMDAMKWTFNYGEITATTANLRKYVAPFATWFTKVVPLAAETAVKHPLRFWKWMGAFQYAQSQAIEDVGMSNEEWDSFKQDLPDYIKKGMYLLMPWRDQQKRLQMLNLTYILPGYGDAAELSSMMGGGAGGFQIPNPLVSIAAGISSGRRFSGAPIFFDWEAPATKFAKTMGYVWEQLSPAVAPGGTDWRTMQRALTEQEGAPTVEQAMLSLTGFKLTPLDERHVRRRKAVVDKIHLSEMATQRKRELKAAKSDEEYNKVLDKYRKLKESIVHP